jgi:hypothetical protein
MVQPDRGLYWQLTQLGLANNVLDRQLGTLEHGYAKRIVCRRLVCSCRTQNVIFTANWPERGPPIW